MKFIQFKYLGTVITQTNDTHKAINKSIEMDLSAFAFGNLYRLIQLSTNIKI